MEINAVTKAQRYVEAHRADGDFSVAKVCRAVGYSRRQLDRLFLKYLGLTVSGYINAVVLSESAKTLIGSDASVTEVALDSHFASPEGYSRAFARRFSLTPDRYRREKTAIPMFTQYPANHYSILKEGKTMENPGIVTVTQCDRPKRKLIYLTSRRADGYLSFCEEMGCDWEGLLNSIPEKLDTAALLELPRFLTEAGMSRVAAGVEVPLDYAKPLPEGYRVAELEPCTMLYFQSEPYENPDDFGKYIGQVFKAIENYDLARHGLAPAEDLAPEFNFGAETHSGARAAIPVVRK